MQKQCGTCVILECALCDFTKMKPYMHCEERLSSCIQDFTQIKVSNPDVDKFPNLCRISNPGTKSYS